MGLCRICGRESVVISDSIGFCSNCLRTKWNEAREVIDEVHFESRSSIGLTPVTPSSPGGLKCACCGRNCSMGIGELGYCSVRVNVDNVLKYTTGDSRVAIGLYYYDPHPTNCVAFPVCPATTGRGYPRYALRPNGEFGYYNVAIFMSGCNLNCLYCQNWEYREMSARRRPLLTIEDLAGAVNRRTTCACFFGGDPGPWSTFVLEASKRMRERAESINLNVFRICWETNGLWNEALFKKAVEYSLESGGIVKVDFKAWSYEIYHALTGVDPEHVETIKRNLERAASKYSERREPPLLVVSTLVVPGYVDEHEVDSITKFLASLNPEIPYVLLAFHPDYKLMDLPRTSIKHMSIAVEIARRNGLRNVYVGNKWLLGNYY